MGDRSQRIGELIHAVIPHCQESNTLLINIYDQQGQLMDFSFEHGINARVPPQMKNALLAIASVALLFGGMFARSWYKNRQADKSSFLAKENISTFVRDHSQTLGSDDAKVYIVEFMDPACEPFPEVDTRWKPTVVLSVAGC